LEDCNSDLRILNGNNFFMEFKFGNIRSSVEFMRVEILTLEQQASISSGISLATFARWRHYYATRATR